MAIIVLPVPGWPMSSTLPASSRKRSDARLVDQLLINAGLPAGEVEVFDRIQGRQRCEAQQPGVAPGRDCGDLDAEQRRSNTLIADRSCSPGGVEDRGERLGRGGQPQLGQVRPQPLIGLRLPAGHRLHHHDGLGR